MTIKQDLLSWQAFVLYYHVKDFYKIGCIRTVVGIKMLLQGSDWLFKKCLVYDCKGNKSPYI